MTGTAERSRLTTEDRAPARGGPPARTEAFIDGRFVPVNTFDTPDITVPLGGFKQSGVGRDKGMAALDG